MAVSYLDVEQHGIPINRYFADNPDMVLGTMAWDDRMYGNKKETTCNPYENAGFGELLCEALENIHTKLSEYELDNGNEEADTSIPADGVRNFSFTLVDSQVY